MDDTGVVGEDLGDAVSSHGRSAAPSGLSQSSLSQAKPAPTIAGIERIDVAEFHRRLHAQDVGANRHFALVCPICGTVQSMASLVAAGATPEKAERQIGFSCEGRLTGAGAWSTKPSRKAVRGCDWSLGGLFKLHRLEVVADGEIHPRFEVATPEQAQALASADTRPQGGDAAQTAAPFTSGAVAKPDAQVEPS